MTTLLQQAINLAKARRREEAESLLRQVLVQQPDNEVAWIWLSGVTRDQTVKREALTRVLAINPDNALAQKGLAIFSPPSPESRPLKSSGTGQPPVSGSPPGEPGLDAAVPASPQPPSSTPPADLDFEAEVLPASERPLSPLADLETGFDLENELPFAFETEERETTETPAVADAFDLGESLPFVLDEEVSDSLPSATTAAEDEFDWEAKLPWEEASSWEDISDQPEFPTFSFEPEAEGETIEEPSFDLGDATIPAPDFGDMPDISSEPTETIDSDVEAERDRLARLEADVTLEAPAEQTIDDIAAFPEWPEESEVDDQISLQARQKEATGETEAEVRPIEAESEPAEEKREAIDVEAMALARQRQKRQQQLLILATLLFVFVVVIAVSLTIFDDAVGRYTVLPSPAQLERSASRPRNNEATMNFNGYPGAKARVQWTQADDAPSCDGSGAGLLVDFQVGEAEPVHNRFCRNGSCAFERELGQQSITTVKVTYVCGQDAIITLFKAVE